MSTQSQWLAALQPASWRGQTMYVDRGSFSAQRSTVVHVFPYRDTPFVEDMGRAPRELRLNCYLVTDDDGLVWDQRKDFIEICENQVGVGELIHPSRGSLQAVLTQCQMSESHEEGGVANVEMTFIVLDSDGQNSSDDSQDDTSADLSDAADNADEGFLGSIKSGIGDVTSTISGAAKEVQGYVGQVKSVLGQATRSLGVVSSVGSAFGLNLGRYINAPLSFANKALRPLSSGLSTAAGLNTGVNNALNGLAKLKTNASNAADNISSFVERNL